ncbi:double-strand break repair helicase AddA [Pseudaestuariivita sp.]|uniref:double-strand break repair helicase AddA n=1 Tax=Pseudaestuariivita sp. TaxID=2211669 RepID=UPI00405876EF
MTPRDDATLAQHIAAQPLANTWLSANAGSGKTRVLTDRVARLLLRDVAPEQILCLTYTTAAASEMQNRLFQRLGGWVMLESADLVTALRELGEDGPFDDETLGKARTLFAKAIETPGGLKIQTIHSFCATLLRRFPLEAGVSPNFQEIDERSAELLRADVVERMASGPHAPLVEALAMAMGSETFEKLTELMVRHRDAFTRPVTRDTICGWYGLPAGYTVADAAEQALAPGDMHSLAAFVADLKSSTSTMIKAGEKLTQITALDASAVPILEEVFLTKTGTPRANFPVKDMREDNPEQAEWIRDWMQAVEDARRRRIALENVDRTEALHRFAQTFLPAYDAAKTAQGVLDYDDLVNKARALLTDPEAAQWVLYRLDGGIEHILVDEAQDTSPLQWEVIDRLALEITSGEGAGANRARTLFVVGDKKQSIYSFQGADPGAFDRMRGTFSDRLAHGTAPLQDRTLQHSFRSAPEILSLVDETLQGKTTSGFDAQGTHRAFHDAMPGQVDLWPVIAKEETPEQPDFEDPVDVVQPSDAQRVLAGHVASEIKRMLDTETPIAIRTPEGDWMARPAKPGDFLILVRSRTGVFPEIIRALKEAGVPTAGNDRIKVGAELAVRDLRAMLSVLALPEDNLSLAAVLKSPLFGWTEQQLYTLAHHRTSPFLWHALREAPEHRETAEVFHALMAQTDFLRPFDLLERILTRYDGRTRLLSRLGVQAEDGINALLSQALAYEQAEIPSLTGFLAWMETDDLTIKRQVPQQADEVRVMSVHGAKGLEAPVVILPDTHKSRPRDLDRVLVSDGCAFWRPNAADACPQTSRVSTATREAEQAERDRLLYVAMTRAEQRLIVCAAGDIGKKPDESWYGMVADGMRKCDAALLDLPALAEGGPGLRLGGHAWPAVIAAEDTQGTPPSALPEWVTERAPVPPPQTALLSPSDLGGAKALPGELGQDTDAAKRFGSLVHLLLEHLPPLAPALRVEAAQTLAGADHADILAEALAHVATCLDAPALAHVFAKDALVEVPITAPLPQLGGARMSGVIDRLIVTDDIVHAYDFKSNAVVPQSAEDVPEGLLRQMGAYAAALAQVFPGKTVETALIWTSTGAVQPLPHKMVMEALSRAVHLDASQGPA